MHENNTLLRPPWLNFARILWILSAAIVLVVLFIGIPSLRDALFPPCTPLNAACGPWQVSSEDMALARALGLPVTLLEIVYSFVGIFPKFFFIAVGVLIFWRKSTDWVALLLSAMLTGFAIEGVEPGGVIGLLKAIVYLAITAIFYALPFIFPSGRIEPRWLRPIFPFLLAFLVPPGAFPAFLIGLSPDLFALWLSVSFFLWFVLGGYAALYRYLRVSDVRERQQTKWVLAGILGSFIIFIPFILTFMLFPPTRPSPERLAFMYLVYLPINFVSYLFIPISIAVAIFRYRLWDIDVIIRKTLTYALVAVLLSLVYFGSVVLLQQVFALMSGLRSDVITVLSTLTIAALFVPLRNRVQAIIDKRFYRSKYNTQKVLSEFANTVRDETNLENLTGRLIQVVDETMQPKTVSLWLKPDHPTDQAR